MYVEIKTPTRIELVPETELEDVILRGGIWATGMEEPGPLEINVGRLILVRVNIEDTEEVEVADPGGEGE